MKIMHLAIDLGSTEFKSAIFADDMSAVGSASRKVVYMRNGEKVESGVEEALDSFRWIVREAIRSAGANVCNISAVAITSQAQTFTIADMKGEPQMPFISWLDSRASDTCEKMKKDPVFTDFAEHSSISSLLAGTQICLLKHILDNGGNWNRSGIGNLLVMPLPSYLVVLLTGHCVTDGNIAAMSGLFSFTGNKYWKPALDYLDLSEKNLPCVVDEDIGVTPMI